MLFYGDSHGNIVMFYPKEKNRNMFNLSGLSYNLNNSYKTLRVYEFNKILANSYESIGCIFFENCHFDLVVSIKW